MRLFLATVFAFSAIVYLDTPAQASIVMLPTATGKITSSFGIRRHPILKRFAMHNGIDFKAKRNEALYSISDGIVRSAGRRGSFGNVVEIYYPHEKASALYAHLNKIDVTAGQTVEPGEVIGLAGSTGRSTGPHLHLQMKSLTGRAIDPQVFLKNAAIAQVSLPTSTGQRVVNELRVTGREATEKNTEAVEPAPAVTTLGNPPSYLSESVASREIARSDVEDSVQAKLTPVKINFVTECTANVRIFFDTLIALLD